MFTRLSLTLAAIALFTLAVGLTGGAVPAQPTDRPWLFLSTSDKESTSQNPTAPLKTILLRPNVEQMLYLYIRNPTEREQKLTVVLATGPDAGEEFVTEAVSVPPQTTVRVRPPKPAPLPAGAKAVPPSATPLHGLLHLRLLSDADTLERTPMTVSILVPSQYVAVENIAFKGEPGSPSNRLDVTVSDSKARSAFVGPFPGPPAKVALDLSPARVPGLIPESLRDSTLLDSLRSGGTARLVAANLRFRGPDRNGIIAVGVDNFERAFLYETDFGGTVPQPATHTVLRIAGPRYFVPGKPCPIRLEVDKPPSTDEGFRVEFGIDRSNSDQFATNLYDGERFQKMEARWDPAAGGLVFVTEVRDWIDELDTAGLSGPRRLRLRLLDKKTGDVLKKQNRNEPAIVEDVIVFDDTPPEELHLGPIGKAVRNQKVDVSASAVDPESGIARVLFFLGEPPAPDGKPAPGGRVVVADPPLTPGAPYSAQLQLPERSGRVQIGVRFVNNAGLAAKDVTDEIEVADPPPKPTTGTIKVTVVQGTNPLPQSGAPVELRDAANKTVLKTAKANDQGEVTFEDVAPGTYNLFSNVPRDVFAKALQPVTVEAGKTATVTLDLRR